MNVTGKPLKILNGLALGTTVVLLGHCAPLGLNSEELGAVELSIRSTMGRSNSALNSSGALVTLSTDYCYALMISGEGHPELSKAPINRGSSSCDRKPKFIGQMAGLFNKGDSVDLSVPLGNARRFDLIALKKNPTLSAFTPAPTDCSGVFEISQGPQFSNDNSFRTVQQTLNGTNVRYDIRLIASKVAPILPGLNEVVLEAEAGPNGVRIDCGSSGGEFGYQTTSSTYELGSPISENQPVPTITAASGFQFDIDPDLPEGLELNLNTGAISGTPSEVRENKFYVVRGVGPQAIKYARISIEVEEADPAVSVPDLVYQNPNALYFQNASIDPNLVNSPSSGSFADFTISPALPAGILINPATGTLSGAPTGTSPVQLYTVNATYAGLSVSTTIQLAVESRANNSWTNTSAGMNVPSPRLNHCAIWTGSTGDYRTANRMIVWGGMSPGPSFLDSGGVYDPTSDTWTTITGTPPTGRAFHTCVWNGHKMIIFGGVTVGSAPLNSLSYVSFQRATGLWIYENTATGTGDIPVARDGHTALWIGDSGNSATDNSMFVYGGASSSGTIDDLKAFQEHGEWFGFGNSGSLVRGHQTIWTGDTSDTSSEYKIVNWGGLDENGVPSAAGTVYAVNTGVWSVAGAGGGAPPSARYSHSMVWTGAQVLVWGGRDYSGTPYTNSGGIYNVAADSWTALPTSGGPGARANATSIWTGDKMIVWGGFDGTYYLAGGAMYDPIGSSWTTMTTAAAPSGRVSFSSVWTGSEMIVWGGATNATQFNSGGRYRP